MRQRGIADGSAVAALVGCLELAVLLTVLLPTNDYRARLWFLLDTSGRGVPLELFVWAAVWLPAAGLLVVLRRATLWSLLGAGAAALVVVGALVAHGFTWVPEFTGNTEKTFVIGCVAGASLLVLRWELRRKQIGKRTA